MGLTVLNVAFPMARVTADPIGGAEQILSHLDRAVVAAGGRSLVLAAEGSSPAGELIPVRQPARAIDAAAWRFVHEQVRTLLARVIADERPDLVHFHGIDFHSYLPEEGPPALVTLHLPLGWYPPHALAPPRRDVRLVPVSHDQARRAPPGARLSPPVENGVDVEAFQPGRKHRFAVALGRVCPEKGFHLALDAAAAADLPLLLAGAVFPYPEHERYFRREILPRLGGRRRWIGAVTGPAKRRLIAAARCLVVPSLAPETSSLVAREALAAGTPVVALRDAGALNEVIEPGRTGVIAGQPEDLPRAMIEAAALPSAPCRQAAEQRFSARAMVARYLQAYRELASGAHGRLESAA